MKRALLIIFAMFVMASCDPVPQVIETVVFVDVAPAAPTREAVVTADCDQVTFTAPADSRVIFSLDSSPPGEVVNGNTVTQQFFPLGVDANLNTIVMDTHHWGLTVLQHGVQVAVQAGDVGPGCAFAHLDTALEP